jgi:hypothetical protein
MAGARAFTAAAMNNPFTQKYFGALGYAAGMALSILAQSLIEHYAEIAMNELRSGLGFQLYETDMAKAVERWGSDFREVAVYGRPIENDGWRIGSLFTAPEEALGLMHSGVAIGEVGADFTTDAVYSETGNGAMGLAGCKGVCEMNARLTEESFFTAPLSAIDTERGPSYFVSTATADMMISKSNWAFGIYLLFSNGVCHSNSNLMMTAAGINTWLPGGYFYLGPGTAGEIFSDLTGNYMDRKMRGE